MNALKLSTLPSLRLDEVTGKPLKEPDGFVDEQVLLGLVTGNPMPRATIQPGDLVLPADDMDFAGWSLPDFQPSRIAATGSSTSRRPSLPVVEEPGLGEPHRGTHRWWIAGLAGALSTMLFSLLLMTLSSRFRENPEGISWIKVPESATPVPGRSQDTAKEAPELTGLPDVK